MHLNSCTLIGRVGKNGPKLSYASSGAPTCTFTLEVDELSKSGALFTTFLAVEIWGQAEHAAELLEAGNEVLISGAKLKYKSVLDSKTQQKSSKLIVSAWGVSQRIPALSESAQAQSSGEGEGVHQGDESTNAHRGDEREPAPKARRPRRLTEGPRWTGKNSALQN